MEGPISNPTGLALALALRIAPITELSDRPFGLETRRPKREMQCRPEAQLASCAGGDVSDIAPNLILLLSAYYTLLSHFYT